MMGNEVVREYKIDGKGYTLIGCWDGDTPENEFDFFDLFDDETGLCLTEGEPYFEIPTEDEIRIDVLERRPVP
jgi:hypothetical protein